MVPKITSQNIENFFEFKFHDKKLEYKIKIIFSQAMFLSEPKVTVMFSLFSIGIQKISWN